MKKLSPFDRVALLVSFGALTIVIIFAQSLGAMLLELLLVGIAMLAISLI